MLWSELRDLKDEIDYGTPPRAGPVVTLTIDGQSVSVPQGSSVMFAAAQARQSIPKLCATDTLEAWGSCRLCLVEIEGRSGFPASCTTRSSRRAWPSAPNRKSCNSSAKACLNSICRIFPPRM